MQDRTESLIVLLIAIVDGVPILLPGLFPPSSMYIWQAGFLLLWFFSAFWAFSLARLLSVPLYRGQALGLGLVAVGWLAFNYSFLLSNGLISNLIYPLVLLLTFFWVDASVLASRKSDPLYRNTLHWKELRWVLWPVLLGALVAWIAGLAVDPVGFQIVLPNGVNLNGPPVASILLLMLFLSVAIPGPVYLLAAALRSKDRTLRRHLFWFGFFAVSFFFFAFVGGLTQQPVFFGAAYVVGTYCLYRSAKSLAPLNRLPR